MFGNTLRLAIGGTVLVIGLAATEASACERSLRSRSIPPSEASTATSTTRYTLSTRGVFTVVRTLTTPIPSTAASCSVVLQGKTRRRLGNISRLQTLDTHSSTQPVVTFSATRLPAVMADRVGARRVQPELHVRVATTCVDSGGVTVFEDKSPVVGRFADCGFSRNEVAMNTFITTLKRRLTAR
jgi:hypothetical protein